MLYVPQGYHNGVSVCPDDSQFPDLWDDLLFGWDPTAQDGQGKIVGLAGGIDRTFTALASGNWRATEEGRQTPAYNGSSFADATAATLNLTGLTQITVVFDLYWDAFADDDDLGMESSANFNTNSGGLLIDPNSSSTSFAFGVRGGGGDYNTVRVPRPTAAAWHSYLWSIDLALAATTVPGASREIFIDGVLQTQTSVLMAATAATDFGNYVWYFMSRAAASLFGAGRKGKCSIYRGIKSQELAERSTQGETPYVRRARPKTYFIGLGTGIRFDAASNSGYQAAASTYNWSHTCTGSDRFLAVDVSLLSAGSTVTSITYNGVALSFIGAQSTVTSFGRVESWGLVNPASGSNSIAVTLSGTIASAGTAVSYTGVHQTTPTEAFNSAQATNTGSATDASVVVTAVAGQCWIHAAVATDDGSVTAGQTSRNNVTGVGGSGADEDFGPQAAGAKTMSYTGLGIVATWAIGGYAIRPVGASSGSVIGNPNSLLLAGGSPF